MAAGAVPLLVGVIQPRLRRSANPETDTPTEVVPAALGSLESAAYLTAWIIGRPEFIAVWLPLKVAVGWRENVISSQRDTRRAFTITLFSMLLNLMVSTFMFAVARSEGII